MILFQLIIFTVVFIFFTLYKDYIIDTQYRETTQEKKNLLNKRWVVFYIIGLIITILMYA
jgi:hypothetical protein